MDINEKLRSLTREQARELAGHLNENFKGNSPKTTKATAKKAAAPKKSSSKKK